MNNILINKSYLQILHYAYNKVLNFKIFNIQRRKLIFEPEKNTSIHILKVDELRIGHERHCRKPNTRRIIEKQTVLKKKEQKKFLIN